MHWARAVALFRDTEFQTGYTPEVMKSGWQEDLLGCSVDQWVSAGFALHSALMQGSRYPFEWTSELQPILDAFGGAEGFDRIIRQDYSASVEEFRTKRRGHVLQFGGTPGEQFLREPFAYNPLFTKPLITDIADHFVAPCFPAVEVRASTLGVVYEGTARWGEAFRRDTGHLFEQYVGRQLQQIEGARIEAERTYGPKGRRTKTTDWLVILPDVVLLVECKAMTPNRNLQEGFGTVEEVHARLGKSIEQINKSVGALGIGHEELSDIHNDRPIVALVVTLGNFVLANSPEVRDSLPVPTVPLAFVGADFVEALVTADPAGLSHALANARASEGQPGVLLLDELELIGNSNLLLNEALMSLPILSFLPPLGSTG